jgi:hypothetical protein
LTPISKVKGIVIIEPILGIRNPVPKLPAVLLESITARFWASPGRAEV